MRLDTSNNLRTEAEYAKEFHDLWDDLLRTVYLKESTEAGRNQAEKMWSDTMMTPMAAVIFLGNPNNPANVVIKGQKARLKRWRAWLKSKDHQMLDDGYYWVVSNTYSKPRLAWVDDNSISFFGDDFVFDNCGYYKVLRENGDHIERTTVKPPTAKAMRLHRANQLTADGHAVTTKRKTKRG
jgi:hypothetical protein